MPETTMTRPQVTIQLTVNGQPRALTIEPRETLADVLRDRLALTGTKVSCDAQVCGACTVLVDALPVSACTFLAVDADGRRVRSVEGLAVDGRLSPLQQAFVDQAAFQCAFCTAGMLMAGTALLEEHPQPTREQVVHGLEGNLCRCTGYEPIIEAVLQAAQTLAADGHATAALAAPGHDPQPRDPAAEPVEAQQ